jgi:hypothetical protein
MSSPALYKGTKAWTVSSETCDTGGHPVNLIDVHGYYDQDIVSVLSSFFLPIGYACHSTCSDGFGAGLLWPGRGEQRHLVRTTQQGRIPPGLGPAQRLQGAVGQPDFRTHTAHRRISWQERHACGVGLSEGQGRRYHAVVHGPLVVDGGDWVVGRDASGHHSVLGEVQAEQAAVGAVVVIP